VTDVAVPSPRTPAQPGDRRRTTRAGWTLLGLAAFALSAWPTVRTFLVECPDEIWQVDLEVYREASRSVLLGRPVYGWLTDNPQFLPFTYPPFSALAGLPLAFVPFRVAGWSWTLLQLALLWVCAYVAFRPLVRRAGHRSGLVLGLVAAALAWTQPVVDGIRFGQVNAVIVTLCLVDVVLLREAGRNTGEDRDPAPPSRVPRWLSNCPQGVLVGLAAAIKLTPAVFWIHWAVARRWKPLATSVVTAAGTTLATAFVLPSATAAFWTDAVLDPERLGPNNTTSNQSLRGALMRIVSEGPALNIGWALVALLVAWAGFRLSARLQQRGETVAVVAVVGVLAVLLSPVSWIHHMHWGIVTVGALLVDGRDRRRIAAAAVALAVLWSKLPWWGGDMVRNSEAPLWFAGLLEDSYTLLGLLSLLGLWWFVGRGRAVEAGRT
jgi:alpha-1,2-mannosyltransferase